MGNAGTTFLARLARFFRFTQFAILQVLQRNIVSLKRSWLFSPTTQPDAWRSIDHRTDLYQSRIFRPKAGKDGPLPVVIMVHGGGFIMNNPSADDPLSRLLADTCGCLVLSIDYRKAPWNKSPAAYDDVVGSTLALLEGETGKGLPIDHSKVFFCGSSAGGNLVLAAAQDRRLKGRLRGIIAMYPPVNLAATFEEQMATRPDPSVPDMLGPAYNHLGDLYLGTDDAKVLNDPRLSPLFYEQREDLPERIFMIGCEHDLLCHYAKVMAEKLVADTTSEKEVIENGWQVDHVRWKLLKGQTHAFDHFPKKTLQDEKQRVSVKDSLYSELASWLSNAFDEVGDES